MNRYHKLKRRAFDLLELDLADDIVDDIFDGFIVILILLNVLAVILGSVKSIELKYGTFLYQFEVISVILFTIEYVARIWSCTSHKEFRHPIKGRLKYASSFFGVIDLLAVLPFYLPILIAFDLRFLRALRLFRLFRLFKIGRYSQSFSTLANVLRAKKEEIAVVAFAILILLIIISSAMYMVEHEAQPKAFADIPTAMWWGIITLTTIGYGDIVPITPVGKFLGSLIAVLGIGMFALPAGILASGFAEEVKKRKAESQICPHCKKEIVSQAEQILKQTLDHSPE